MKTLKKAILSLVAVLVIAVALCTITTTASAATKTKKLTLFVGEKINIYTIGGKMKSVKSSKKKVCAAKKKSGDALLTAKKAGKSKITIKTTRGTLVYNVTVKKNPFEIAFTPIADGNLMVSVKNNSGGYFDWIDLNVTLCDAAGNPVTQKNDSVFYVGSKQTSYSQITVYEKGIDLSKTQITVPSWKRTPDAKYKNYAKNVNVSEFEENGYIKMRANTNYNGKGNVYVANDIVFKDAAGQILKVTNESVSLYKSKKVDTTYGTRMPEGAVGYEVISNRVYVKNY